MEPTGRMIRSEGKGWGVCRNGKTVGQYERAWMYDEPCESGVSEGKEGMYDLLLFLSFDPLLITIHEQEREAKRKVSVTIHPGTPHEGDKRNHPTTFRPPAPLVAQRQRSEVVFSGMYKRERSSPVAIEE